MRVGSRLLRFLLPVSCLAFAGQWPSGAGRSAGRAFGPSRVRVQDGLLLDPSVFVIDSGVTYAAVSQRDAAVGFNGENFLVVWEDGRGVGADIHGARVDTSGAVLDLSSLPIARAAGNQVQPAVAWCHSLYLVVWQDTRRGSPGSIYGARVSRLGTVLDPEGVVIHADQYGQGYPEVAAGDSGWLVVWEQQGTTLDVFGARVGLSGRVLDPRGIVIASGAGDQRAPAVAYDGRNFMVVWQTNRYGGWMVWGTRVNEPGRVLDPGGFPIAGDASQVFPAEEPSVASDAVGFLVAWHGGDSSQVYSQLVAADGRRQGEPVRLSPFPARRSEHACVAFDGANYLVAWQEVMSHNVTDYWDIYGRRVSRSGDVCDSVLTLTAAYSNDLQAAAVSGAGLSLVVWHNEERSVVVGTLVDTSGHVRRTPFRVSSLQPLYADQDKPSLSQTGVGYVAAWQSAGAITARLLDADGLPCDTGPTTVTSGSWARGSPAVALGDSDLLVASNRGYLGVVAARVSSAGSVLDPSGIKVTFNGEEPDVAFDGTNFLVVWFRSETQRGVYAARVSQTGAVLDTEGFPVIATSTSFNPAVAFDGANYLVVWEANALVYGARVTPSGAVLDPYGFLISGGHGGRYPDVAFDGTNYLAVWTSYGEIYGARVTPSAQILDPEARTLSWGSRSSNRMYPAVAFGTSSYVVCWEEDYLGAIRGSLVDLDGTVVDSLEATTPLGHLATPALCRGSDGRVLLAFSGPARGIGGCDTLDRIWAGFIGLPVGVGEYRLGGSRPRAFDARPNPFRSTVAFAVLGEVVKPQIRIRDAAGRCVRVIAVRGGDEPVWDGTDGTGMPVPPGVYFCELAGKQSRTSVRLVRVE